MCIQSELKFDTDSHEKCHKREIEIIKDRDEWKSRFDKLVETLCRIKEQGNFNKEAFEEVGDHLDFSNKNEDVPEAQPYPNSNVNEQCDKSKAPPDKIDKLAGDKITQKFGFQSS